LKDALDSGDELRITEARRLFWDSKNWQSLCKHHHDVKTATEDGGFGRRSQAQAGGG
jgi:5-methylcytosine-specific restriction protein A